MEFICCLVLEIYLGQFYLMNREKIVTALDIGSSSVRVGCALLREEGPPQLVGVGQSASLGVRRGQIVDIKEVVASLKEAFLAAERTAGVKISKAIVTLGGPQVELMNSSGSVAISRADGEVSGEDVSRVLGAAQAVSIPQNKQIIYTLPFSYSVDNDQDIEDPLGMKGVRLGVDTLLVLVSHPVIRAIKKALAEVNIQPEGWLYEPFAVSRAVLSKKHKEAGVLLVNIGGGMTTLSVFGERRLRHATILPLGASNVTHDVAIGLKAAIDVAERVKVEYGSCFTPNVSKREQVVLADWGVEDVSVSRYALAQMIEARYSEIFLGIAKEVRKFIKEKSLPAGVVLTGGGAKTTGIVELAKRELKIPVHMGRIREIESDLAEAFDPAYSAIIGSILWAWDEEKANSGELLSSFETQGFMHKAKEWLRELLP